MKKIALAALLASCVVGSWDVIAGRAPASSGNQQSTTATDPARLSFNRDIRPILMAKCFDCHVRRAQGKFEVRSRASIFKGGEDGPGVVPGSLKKSVLWERIEEGAMPPKGRPRLTKSEIERIRLWILQKAPA